ncbi:hypothetical protein [Saccharothrix lopnurensis]|uniref:DUF4760 domain-containing protein n=1 Tax=Saccharothrix lopnurensis TaxID=1670621 RepID=A0ABW1PDA9_9PSEU
MQRSLLWAAIALVGATAVLLVVPIWFLNADQYQALATGVQALGVTVALVFGAGTLLSDTRNRRVDRALALHAELTTGDVQAARVRLLLRLQAAREEGKVRPVSLDRLRTDGEFAAYADPAQGRPIRDANVVLRHFDRVNAARVAGIVDLPFLHELIGVHALWWDRAITRDEDEPLLRRGLAELATWVERHSRTEARDAHYLEGWARYLRRDFAEPGEDPAALR